MRRLVCWLDGFLGTLLSLGRYEADGHVYDWDARFWRVEGDREYEYAPCVRCGQTVEQGWRTMP